MEERYWALFTSYKCKEFYYEHYNTSSAFIDGLLKCMLAVASAGSIATWAVWNRVPWAWALIVAASQLLHILLPHLPYARQRMALKFLLPEFRAALIDISNSWNGIMNGEYDNATIASLFYEYEVRLNDMRTKYIGDTPFPVRKRCHRKAEIDYVTYFSQRYNSVRENANDKDKET